MTEPQQDERQLVVHEERVTAVFAMAPVAPPPPAASHVVDSLIERVDVVLGRYKRLEAIYIGCSLVLFLAGIGCLVTAIVTAQFAWATPSVLTTLLLYWPIDKIHKIRRDNIALATAPAIIKLLPTEKAAEELQKLIQRLYGDGPNG